MLFIVYSQLLLNDRVLPAAAMYPHDKLIDITDPITRPEKSTAEMPPPPARYSPDKLLACIAGIRRRHVAQLQDIFRNPKLQKAPLLLVDPAQHANLGDTLLVRGERDFFAAMGWGEQSVHECSLVQATAGRPCQSLVKSSARGAYQLAAWQAGGNWGDVWLKVQAARIPSIRYLLEAGLTVVSMPQSLQYNTKAAEERETKALAAAAAVAGGPGESRKRLVFLWRQENSHAEAERLYPFADNRLVPDIAFWCGPFLPSGGLQDDAPVDVLLLLRGDKESTVGRAQLENATAALRRSIAETGGNLTFRVADWDQVRHLRAHKPADYQPKVDSAVRLLNQGRVVVTNRLHATVLSLLSLKPVFYVDQSYGKIRRSLAVAFNSSAACREEGDVRAFATASLEEALPRAARFAEECRAQGEC
jgi:exopolysaccharide biosynthesis predicted pyruvyltransferase EpsI